ncbi:hypothetical protein AB1283_04295 [Bacillus sp. S13(2024)]|uniref:hypothetical protein n=1 Tax=unclassified Bacillus (in: firmicutes) TaxID=185979 RepID=UPI003D21941F
MYYDGHFYNCYDSLLYTEYKIHLKKNEETQSVKIKRQKETALVGGFFFAYTINHSKIDTPT